jgi:arginyl-tRNA synthetase
MRETLRATLQKIGDEKTSFEIRRHAPKEFEKRGEYSSNIALALAAQGGSTPDAVAAQLQHQFSWPGVICTATKGFLNFRMNDETLHQFVERALDEGERYGGSTPAAGQRVNVEFVSADPSGPLHLVHGRIAVAGDALCRVLSFSGADVTREYFLNDDETSAKMRLLGESVAAHYNRSFGRDEEMPEGALQDAFVKNVAQSIAEREGNALLLRPETERISTFAHAAREAAVESQRQTLRALNVHFDVWNSESALLRDNRLQSVATRLQNAGHAYEQGGTLWLKSTAFGDEADRPLRRQGGEWTYLASDIAYHAFRFERGFDLLINVWTSQHEQYVARTRAALEAAAYPAQNLEVVVCEETQLLRDGAAQRELLLDDALEIIEAENLRFLWLLSPWDEVSKIEIETARRDDESNPAYAARLLPARLNALLREAENRVPGELQSPPQEWSEPQRQLARLVALWPDEAALAAEERRPQRVARFALELAEATQQMLSASRPAGSTPAPLLRAAHITATNALRILGMKPTDKF